MHREESSLLSSCIPLSSREEMARTGRDVYPMLGRISFIYSQSVSEVLIVREDYVEEGDRRRDYVIFAIAMLADMSHSLPLHHPNERQSF